MISRIYVAPKIKDSRKRLFLKSWNNLDLSAKVSGVSIIDSYLIDSEFSNSALLKMANALTNQILEKFSINKIPEEKKSLIPWKSDSCRA